MKNRPNWYTNDSDSAWDRVKTAFSNDWEQTKHDFGSKRARDLNQDVDDTVKQATGADDAFENHEQAFRFGYAAQRQYKSRYPTWNSDLDKALRTDYGDNYELDRDYIRHAYEYRGTGSSDTAGVRDESRL